MYDQIGKVLDDIFPPTLCSALVDALTDGCRAVAERYCEEDGSNGYTFGYDAYHFNVHRLKRLSERPELGLVVLETPNELEFKMRVGGQLTLACHRVGSSADEPIESAFPSSPGGPGRMARQNAIQLSLALEFGGVPSYPENVVLAYMANPYTGLEAVYLAVPTGSSDRGRINEWAYAKPVWRRDEGAGRGITPVDLPLEVPIGDAPIELRPLVIADSPSS